MAQQYEREKSLSFEPSGMNYCAASGHDHETDNKSTERKKHLSWKIQEAKIRSTRRLNFSIELDLRRSGVECKEGGGALLLFQLPAFETKERFGLLIRSYSSLSVA